MAIVEGQQKAHSLDIRGQLGYSGGFGLIRFGYTRLGLYNELNGIYQRKLTLKGWRTSRMRHYRPTNPQTTIQQDWRAVFAAGWTGYNALTTDEKLQLSKEARHYRLSGPQLFMRRWLQSQRA